MNIETRVKKIRDVLGDAVVQNTFKKLAQIELGRTMGSGLHGLLPKPEF